MGWPEEESQSTLWNSLLFRALQNIEYRANQAPWCWLGSIRQRVIHRKTQDFARLALAMPSCLAYLSPMRNAIAAHYAKIGRLGGSASSPAKRLAARLNALRRWRRKLASDVLPMDFLRDGVWYRGRGRNAPAGLWDARAGCFWTIALNDFADPATFPAEPRRQVRLKREDYFSRRTGTFKPLAPLRA